MSNNNAEEVITSSASSSSIIIEPDQIAATTTPENTPKQQKPQIQQTIEEYEYYAIVLDSGPIIKQYDFGMLQNMISGNKASKYVTTASVIQEIRDYQSRQYLNTVVIPLLDLQIRQPTDTSIQQIIAFAKQTGDYSSLSTVDLHVLALTLDMEKEGCSTTSISTSKFDHIRTTPKRKIGLGTILPMQNKNTKKKESTIQEEKKGEEEDDRHQQQPNTLVLGREDYDEVEDDDEGEEDSDDNFASNHGKVATNTTATQERSVVKSSWANLTNPNVKVVNDNDDTTSEISNMHKTDTVTTSTQLLLSNQLASMKVASLSDDGNNGSGGQFDDASDDDDIALSPLCGDDNNNTNTATTTNVHEQQQQQELNMEFPSLAATSTVPFAGEDDDNDGMCDTNNSPGTDDNNSNKVGNDDQNQNNNDSSSSKAKKKSVFLTDDEKRKNLQPVSKSGRVYNSFRNYKSLMAPSTKTKSTKKGMNDTNSSSKQSTTMPNVTQSAATFASSNSSSRIVGSGGVESMLAEDDDGTGWITSFEDIRTIKNESGSGQIVPGVSVVGTASNSNNSNNDKSSSSLKGPALSSRAACATTDFAMQNVLLQMNLILLSSESGMRIRRIKSWVIRCGACFHIHAADDEFTGGTDAHLTMKRLFCSHCGSGDMMQRISASVDGKTGRLKLHFSKRKQGRHHSIRGTKFSLPKPGTGNRYQGRELLLREDQLLSGAWNQKVKIHSGNKYRSSKSESIFGKDIASSVGCNNVRHGRGGSSSASFSTKGWSSSTAANSSNNAFDDIKVGFGARKNPNSAKGRERRGKKKKSSDRACGMRRY